MNEILEDFSPALIADAIEQNGIEGCRAWAVWREMDFHEGRDMAWTITNVPFALFNNVLRARIAPERLEKEIEAALDRVKARGVSMAWWIGPDSRPEDLGKHLEKFGFTLAADSPMMAADLFSFEENPPRPRGLVIDEVTHIAALRTWNRIMTDVYEFPDFARAPWFNMHASMGLGPALPWRHFLGKLDGKPVATASLFFGAGVAGIANVATVEQARVQGIATAMTLALAREARHRGYRITTLFSSKMAEKMYRRLGFQEYGKGGFYIWTNE